MDNSKKNLMSSNGKDNSQGIDAYKWVRGFNYQPSWGSHGMEIWLNFNPEIYALEIDRGLKFFPKMNALRIWMSYDAYLRDREKYLKAVRNACRIIRERGLKTMPVLFNGWHTNPDFGGFSSGMLEITRRRGEWAVERRHAEDVAAAFSDAGDILMLDLANEPFCDMWREKEQLLARDFLQSIAGHLHEKFPGIPLTVGSWGIGKEWRPLWDVDLFAPFLEVISLHPYWITRIYTKQEHQQMIEGLLSDLKKRGKPLIASECCWFSPNNNDIERSEIIRYELGWMKEKGIGFFPHALHHSLVADLHRETYWPGMGCMQFIEKDGSLRKGHEVYNEL